MVSASHNITDISNEKRTATIVVGGDVYPGEGYSELFESGDVASIFNGLLGVFEQADFSVINLECPLIEKSNPIQKSGRVLCAKSKCINGCSNLGVNLINLANNHIMDHGRQGLISTLNSCQSRGIATVGADKNIAEASKLHVSEVNGIKIGVMSVAEHEFSIAGESSYGAAPLDIIENTKAIQKYKDSVDYLILLFHGGNEYYQYPSPRLQKECRFFIDMGVNAVFVQHSHCVGSYEKYNEGHIVYGQGNFVFGASGRKDMFYEGILVKLELTRQKDTISFIPFFQSKECIGLREMNGNELDSFNRQFNERSLNTLNIEFIKSNWFRHCTKRKQEYLSYLLGHNKLLRILTSKGKIANILYSNQLYTSIRNIVLCESHHDVLREIFENHQYAQKHQE